MVEGIRAEGRKGKRGERLRGKGGKGIGEEKEEGEKAGALLGVVF